MLGTWLALELKGPDLSPASAIDLLYSLCKLFPLSGSQFIYVIMGDSLMGWEEQAWLCPLLLVSPGQAPHLSEPPSVSDG